MKAADEGDVLGMLESGLNIAMDVITLFAACFDGDTPVATEDGFRRIDEIQAGDRVWSYNVETGEKELKEVKQVFVNESDEILRLEMGKGEIDATTNHPFYVTGKGWVAAGDLIVGDEIYALSGDTGTVTGLRLEKTGNPIPVYNLEVEDFQSYFVGDGVLVHNKCKYDEYKKPIPPKKGKPKSDVRSLAIFNKIKILRPKIGETPGEAAKRIMDIVSPDGYEKGTGTAFNQLKKYFSDHFE